MISAEHYPEEVKKVAQQAAGIIVESWQEEEEINRDILERVLAESLFTKWTNGAELAWEEEEAQDLIMRSLAESIVSSLVDRGYADSVEDAEGVEWLFLTEKGKQQITDQDSESES